MRARTVLREQARRAGAESAVMNTPPPARTWDEADGTHIDVRGLPDGRFRLRVTADDGLDNDAARAKTSTLVSERVQLDAQPPSCALRVERAKDGLRLRGTVADAGGLLTRLEYRLDDGPWLRVTGPDGLMDRSRLDLDVDLGDTAGASRLELRAGDEFGNWGYFRSSLETAR